MFTGYHFTRPPFLMLDGNDDDKGGGGGDGKNEDKKSDTGYPPNTPVDDMSPEQQAAYWKAQSRKHENRGKALGDWSPDKIAALVKERDDLKKQSLSDDDKAKDALREEGRAEVRAELYKERATSALQRELQGRVPNAAALLGLDISKFIVDGKVDEAALKAWVEDNSEEASGDGKKKNPDQGQGRRGSGDSGASKSVAAGRDLYAERHKKKSTTTS